MNKYYWITGYLLTVLTFAGIYTYLWNSSPDSFIVNEELNMNPFSDVHNYLWGKGKNETSKATKLHELEVELARLYDYTRQAWFAAVGQKFKGTK